VNDEKSSPKVPVENVVEKTYVSILLSRIILAQLEKIG
jgi:hypothetical protein